MVERAMENLAKEGERDDFKNAAITFILQYVLSLHLSQFI